MSDLDKVPEEIGQVADAVKGNWVDHLAPAWSRPYLRLSRADRPIGTWLLLIPCWWGLLLAMLARPEAIGWHDAWIALGCALGAFLMRGAGCTWNDITDRDIDAQVARTRSRPIPSGQVTVRQALIWMILQALISFAILLSFAPLAIALGIASLIPVAIYPFAKRFTWWPQVFLGIAFNWGAVLAYAAHANSIDWQAFVLYGAGIAWTLFYDTIYAYQDTEDDALIGVKSTARLFGDNPGRPMFAFLVATMVLFALAVSGLAGSTPNPLVPILGILGVWGLGMHLLWQMRRLDIRDPKICMLLFRSNRDAGLVPCLALLSAIFFAI